MSSPLGIQICEVLLGLQGYSANSIEESEYHGKIELHIHIHSTRQPQCPICHRALPIFDTRIRHIQHASILCKPIVLVLSLRRTKCPVCGVKTEPQTIADGIKRHSVNLEMMILQFSEKLDNYSIAKLLGFSQSSIYRIDKAGLENLEQWLRSNVPKPVHVSIDEVAHKRRHHYTTVLTNQEDARVIDVSLGKSKQSALSLFRLWGDKLKWVETISMDFSQSYIGATAEYFNENYIVFDRFHFSRIVNRGLEQIRREIQRQLPDHQRRQSKKHSRWLALRRLQNSNSKQLSALEQMKQDNQPLYEAYLLKEMLLSVFDEDIHKDEAEKKLLEWCSIVDNSKFAPFIKLAKQVRQRIHILLNWFKYHISNAKAEAVNNVIKSLLKRAYGYKDFEYFRLKVLQKCGYLMLCLTHLV
jgi:transposase